MNFREFLEAKQEFRPGQEIDEFGNRYEPDNEPVDWDEWLSNVMSGYGGADYTDITPATGYILTNGKAVQMGGRTRDQDHRFAIPTMDAMKRWKWPKEVVKGYGQGTVTPALYEFLKRSGAMRVGLSYGELWVHGLTMPTQAQIRTILYHIRTERPSSVSLQLPSTQGESRTYSIEDAYEIEMVLRGQTRDEEDDEY